ncbi:hypothetical protein Bca4012_060481 [Brassica carinata]
MLKLEMWKINLNVFFDSLHFATWFFSTPSWSRSTHFLHPMLLWKHDQNDFKACLFCIST